jgi:hypothetical protein
VGTSSNPAELVRKINRLAAELADTRKPLNAAALAAKKAFIASEPGVVGHRVARGKIGVRYDIRGNTAVVRFTGPAHLALNPTKAHRIAPKRRRRGGRRRALTIGPDVRAWANHPGTSGKDPGARRAKAAARLVVPKAYAKAGLTDPLRKVFG